MTTGAIAARSEPLGLDVVGFHRRIERIGAGKMMRAWKPLFIDRSVATGGAAGLRFDKELRRDHATGVRASVRWVEISGRESSLMAAESDDGCAGGKHKDPEGHGAQKLDVAILREFASHKAM